jgi:hypothetical protein
VNVLSAIVNHLPKTTKLRKDLSELAGSFLLKAWPSKFKPDVLKQLLTLHIESAEIPLYVLSEITTKQFKNLLKEWDKPEQNLDYRTLSPSTLPIYFKIAFATLVKELSRIEVDGTSDFISF